MAKQADFQPPSRRRCARPTASAPAPDPWQTARRGAVDPQFLRLGNWMRLPQRLASGTMPDAAPATASSGPD